MSKQIRETSRERRKRTPRPVVVIVCEGSKTEPIYFRHFRSRYINVQIEVEGNTGSKTDYNNLINKSILKKKDYIVNTEGEGYVWCVFDADIDSNMPNALSVRAKQLQEAIKTAKMEDINISLSNPCFELWFFLHFNYSTGLLRSYDDVKKRLLAYLPNYDKQIDCYPKLEDKLDEAISNGKRLKSYHNDNGNLDLMDVSINPYTNVWELIEQIQSLSQKSSFTI